MREKGKYEIIRSKHLKEELSMKIKSIVLTAALATAFSAFSDSVNVDWFTTNATSVTSFDTAVGNPVVVTNNVEAPLGIASISGYAITAYVTNLVVFASTPDKKDLNSNTKGAICAAVEGATTNWYGLSSSEWTKLTALSAAPEENASYALKMEFKSDSGAKVRYSVNGILADNGWLDAPDTYVQPNWYAFAGMGFCTNIVGEVFIDVPASSAGVDVQDANGTKVGKIIIDTTKLAASEANDSGANGLKKWVNYVLGIDNPTATSKPYAAPVQNNKGNKLTFSLGGVGNVLGQDVTGAKVTYTVETCNSTSGTWSSAVDTKAEAEYKEPGYSFNEIAVPSGVQYYRIKIKIDPAH